MEPNDVRPGGSGPGPARLLLHDGRVMAVAKPAGVSMATRPGDPEGGAAAVRRLLDAAGIPRPEPLPLLVHRLDAPTSGAVLLALDRETHRELSLAFQERRVVKVYRALAWGHPVPARGLIEAPLARDPRDGRKMRVAPGGVEAATRYETLRRLAGCADLRLFPETGRTHQIRVHLASTGHPIVGDDLYGGATRWHGVRDPGQRAAFASLRRLLLHAERVEVPALSIAVEAPLEEDHGTLLSRLTRGK